MRRPPITAILTAGACALSLAAPAAAQDGAGQRYLAWPTKGEGAEVGGGAPVAPLAYVANPTAAMPRRRAPIIPHGGFGRMPDTAPAQNLTPASAWLGPNAPAYAPVAPPQPYAAPAPTAWSRGLTPPPPAYAAAPPPEAYAPQPQPQPVYAPAPVAAPAYVPPARVTAPPPAPAYVAPVPPPTVAPPQPLPPEEPAPTAVAPDAPAFDPMAPRRDAPIFRLQRPAPSEPVAPPAPATAEPQAAPAARAQPQVQTQARAQPQAPPQPLQAAPQEGARYYSVHRQAGRQPDATPLPPTVYLDALPVDLISPPAATDLAEPPAQPNLIRNSSGRLQAAPDTEIQDQP